MIFIALLIATLADRLGASFWPRGDFRDSFAEGEASKVSIKSRLNVVPAVGFELTAYRGRSGRAGVRSFIDTFEIKRRSILEHIVAQQNAIWRAFQN